MTRPEDSVDGVEGDPRHGRPDDELPGRPLPPQHRSRRQPEPPADPTSRPEVPSPPADPGIPPASRRSDPLYNAPPRIRVTGEVPSVTADVPAVDRVRPADHLAPGPTDAGPEIEVAPDRWEVSGSVVDRPAPSPPDWMSGVQVPELLVTRDIDRGDLASARPQGVGPVLQRLAATVLVAILIAVVILVLLGSVTDLGSGLR